MAGYVDGFLLPVPKRKVDAYRRMAQAVGDDLKIKGMESFTKRVRLKPGETVFFSWIVFKSRGHRDRVNAKVMKDPRIAKMMEPKDMPFDVKRMAYGGFKMLVDL